MTDLRVPSIPKASADAIERIEAVIGTGLARSILDSSPDYIKLISLDGTLLYMNHNGLDAHEVDSLTDIEGRRWPSLWPRESQDMMESAIEDARLGKRSCFDAYCPTSRGLSRWWNVNVAPVYGEDGSTEYILATSRDITTSIVSEQSLRERDMQLQSYTERLSAELIEKDKLIERHSILSAEVDHRVKNSFALIGSILRMKMRFMADGEGREALSDAANRIGILSRVHEQLHGHSEIKTVAIAPYMRKLCEDLGTMLADASEVVLVEAAKITVLADHAIAIGLVTSELVSNALKHRRGGLPIKVSVSLIVNERDKTVLLRVADTGDGLPDGFDLDASSGLGMQICKTYSSSLNGVLRARNKQTGGAVFSMIFPHEMVN